MPSKKQGKKDVAGGESAAESAGSPEEASATEGNNPVLLAIESLRLELGKVKTDIKESLKGEMATLERKIDAKFDAMQLIINDHRTTLEHLEQNATASSDVVTKLQAHVKSLSEQVSELTEKCIDLEGRSKRQNIRIAGIREGLENGQGAREFVAKLLMEASRGSCRLEQWAWQEVGKKWGVPRGMGRAVRSFQLDAKSFLIRIKASPKLNHYILCCLLMYVYKQFYRNTQSNTHTLFADSLTSFTALFSTELTLI